MNPPATMPEVLDAYISHACDLAALMKYEDPAGTVRTVLLELLTELSSAAAADDPKKIAVGMANRLAADIKGLKVMTDAQVEEYRRKKLIPSVPDLIHRLKFDTSNEIRKLVDYVDSQQEF